MSERQMLTEGKIGQIIEAALLAAEGPLTVENLFKLFAEGELAEENGRNLIRDLLAALGEACSDRGVELVQVASGYRYQAKQDLSVWVSRLWEEKPPRYTRALLETLALVTYKQPVTRGDIEQIRGVGVSQNIMRTLLERDWIRVVGQREAPGRPSLYGTTKTFLDYFNLNNLDQLPPLEEIRALIEPTLVAEHQAEGIGEEGSSVVEDLGDVQNYLSENTEDHQEAHLDSAADEPILDSDDAGGSDGEVSPAADAVAETDGEALSGNTGEAQNQYVIDEATSNADYESSQSMNPESSTQSEQN
tara:strand:- start:1175 stop:2086 length:912 start_codon:yes stop_codon:yes gene_type:complete